MKNALIFVDRNTVKVAFGNSLKCFEMDKMTQPNNLAFLDQLFAEYNVAVVEAASVVTRQQFQDALSGIAAAPDVPLVPRQEQPFARSAVVQQPQPYAQPQRQAVPQPQPQPQQLPPQPAEEEGQGQYIKANTKVTIIIDDIPVGPEIAEGIRKGLVIPAGRAICLSSIEPELVKKSTILRRFIQSGLVSIVSANEARRMEAENLAEVQKRQAREDRYLQNSILPQGMKAVDVAAGGIGSMGGGDDITVDITEDVAQAHNFRMAGAAGMASDRVTTAMTERYAGGMSDLLAKIEAAEMIPEAPRRALGARAPVEVVMAKPKGVTYKA